MISSMQSCITLSAVRSWDEKKSQPTLYCVFFFLHNHTYIHIYMLSFRYFYSQLSKGEVFELKMHSLCFLKLCIALWYIWILPAQFHPPAAVKYNFITTTRSLLFIERKSNFLFLCHSVLIEISFKFLV